MLDKIIEKSPAKINLFLKIINKRLDGYHNIRTGITLINLYDEIIVKPSKSFEVKYIGEFAPINNIFEDCIIRKLFVFLNMELPNLKIVVKKNFPIQGGLGSASSNAATVIKILENLELIKRVDKYSYASLGSDIPFFLNEHDCLVRGKGDLISNIIFPKYYFLIVKPNFNCSTIKMYQNINLNDLEYTEEMDLHEINDRDAGNDFENVLMKLEPKFIDLFNFMQELDDSIFTRLSGSGSCIYSAFENIYQCEKANENLKIKFPNLWSACAQNNNI